MAKRKVGGKGPVHCLRGKPSLFSLPAMCGENSEQMDAAEDAGGDLHR